MRNRFNEALNDTLMALHLLGVDVNGTPSKREADLMFDRVKNEILSVGFEEIMAIPRATDPRTDLAVALLNEAGKRHACPIQGWCLRNGSGTNAYWSSGERFSQVIGLTVSACL
jgi:hypothetical protein